MQEAFLKAYRQLGRFEARADFRTWLHKIAVNCAIDLIRARRHRAGAQSTDRPRHGGQRRHAGEPAAVARPADAQHRDRRACHRRSGPAHAARARGLHAAAPRRALDRRDRHLARTQDRSHEDTACSAPCRRCGSCSSRSWTRDTDESDRPSTRHTTTSCCTTTARPPPTPRGSTLHLAVVRRVPRRAAAAAADAGAGRGQRRRRARPRLRGHDVGAAAGPARDAGAVVAAAVAGRRRALGHGRHRWRRSLAVAFYAGRLAREVVGRRPRSRRRSRRRSRGAGARAAARSWRSAITWSARSWCWRRCQRRPLDDDGASRATASAGHRSGGHQSAGPPERRRWPATTRSTSCSTTSSACSSRSPTRRTTSTADDWTALGRASRRQSLRVPCARAHRRAARPATARDQPAKGTDIMTVWGTILVPPSRRCCRAARCAVAPARPPAPARRSRRALDERRAPARPTPGREAERRRGRPNGACRGRARSVEQARADRGPARARASEQRDYDRARRAIDDGQWVQARRRACRTMATAAGARADAALYWKAYALDSLGQRAEALTAIAELDQDASEEPLARRRPGARGAGAPAGGPAGAARRRRRRRAEAAGAERAAVLVARAGDADARAAPAGRRSRSSCKERALFVLAQSGSPEARKVLAEVARQGNPDLQRKAIDYLGVHGTSENRALLAELYQSSPDVGREAPHPARLHGGRRPRARAGGRHRRAAATSCAAKPCASSA